MSGILKSQDNIITQLKSSLSATRFNAPRTLNIMNSTPCFRVPRVQKSQRATCGDHTPGDPVAAMWKAQMQCRMQPTRFRGNCCFFPFFHDQIRTYLESNLLTDNQSVEYIPTFVTGEALEVVRRNRGCSFKDIMKTFEERFVQTIMATQARTEDLVAGPRLTYGDNIGLMYFYEKLNTATEILQGGRHRT